MRGAMLDDVTLDFATLEEIRAAALQRLDPVVGDFLEGGAGDELTLRRNRRAFDRWAFRPRVMSGLAAPTLQTSFLGFDLALPILTAPFGADALFDPDGQVAVARANRRAGSASIAPEAGSHSIEEIAAAGGPAALIGQLHPLGTDESFLRMVRRYEDAGYRALCITCDCPTAGWRERNLRNRFSPDETVLGGNYPPGVGEMQAVFGQLFAQDAAVWSWERLGDLLAGGPLPWIAKGIMTPEDAVAAVAAGASGLLVSNHGGRQLDGQLASADVLPGIRAAVGAHVSIAVDSGIRRGADVVKARALGADAVVLGRLAVYGLAAGGETGVLRVLELLGDEIRTVLTLLGRGGLADLDASALVRAED
jgi:isopentenyl diphosphate isomerase/L-lactate dehydrogenase-like FMN-dependent dehydrogenase